jgi:hypothetical protein
MALLSGSKKKTPPPIPATIGDGGDETAVETEAETAAADVEVQVDVDTMDLKAIAALVKEHEIQTPDNWKKLGLVGQREWLKSKFDPDYQPPAAEQTEQVEQTDEQAAEAVIGKNDEPPATDTPTAPVAPATKAKAGKKAKAGTALSTDVAKHGEVIVEGDDVISDISNLVENLNEADARAMVGALQEGAEFTFVRMGAVLSVIQAKSWFEPHASFKDYVEAEHGIAYRRAMYWIGIYNGLVESEVPWKKVAHLGWSKLAKIVPILTKANVETWVKRSEANTVLQLEEMVKAEQSKLKLGTSAEGGEPKTVTTMTFKVHNDQKVTVEAALKKAKEVSGTDIGTVALEFICLDYLGGNAKSQPLSDTLKDVGIEKAVEAFNAAFPDSQLSMGD